MNPSKEQSERWVKSIREQLPPLQLWYAECLDEGCDEFFNYSAFIVEPGAMNSKDRSDYCDFMDVSMENWKSWVYANLGDAWGHIAYMVVVDGY